LIPEPLRRAIGHAPFPASSILAFVALSLPAIAATSNAAVPFQRLRLDLRNGGGSRIDARVSARAEQYGLWYPVEPDTVTLAHAGYAYPVSGGTLVVPRGLVTLSVSRGPEYVPWTRLVSVGRDTAVTVRLQRFLDMRSLGFFSSDLHVHSRHDPMEFGVSPAAAKRIARAEDLGILHLLDQEFRFTGAPDSLSDANTVLYHSWEHRHMTYGHVVLPGLRTAVPWGCCLAPSEAWPMLSDLAGQVAGPGRALFVLAHPTTTDAYTQDRGWPGTGLGREYPLLAASGRLDGFDVASYSNDPNVRFEDWYDALSSGLALTPTAGTDAVLNWFAPGPAGGWRVYADLGAGAKLDYDAWIEAVRAGRTFVTSLPLVPRFRVGGRGPGEALEAPGDTSTLTVSFDAACATGLTKVSVVSSAGTLWSVDLSRRMPARTRLDTTFTLRVATPVWMALRVDGVGGDRVLLGRPAVAHTNAVRLLQDGQPRADGRGCGRMLDRVDALERLLNVRRNWSAPWHEDSVLAAIRAARAFYGRVFRRAPQHFRLLPPPAEGAERIGWIAAGDDEPGDRVRYRVVVASDPTFADGVSFMTDDPWIGSTPARAGLPSWWRVEAVDRGGNVTPCDPPIFPATLRVATTDAPGGPTAARPRLWPNPARGPVRIAGLGDDVVLFDVTGRRVASSGRGLRAEGEDWVWDVRDRGERARPGLYWVVSRASGVTLRLVLIE